jgi:hypothetical protein
MKEPTLDEMIPLHVTPVTASDEPMHILDGFCWCQPLAEAQPTGGYIYIHRRTLDSPHIEEPED